jgi:hypothetical protein
MDWKRDSDAEELEAAFWDMRGVASATQRTDQVCVMGKMRKQLRAHGMYCLISER